MSRSDSSNEYSAMYLPTDEERYGHFSEHVRDHELTTPTKYNNVFIRGVLSFVLFFCLTLILTIDHDKLQKPKQVITHYLKEEFPFAKVNDWYVSTLGNPLALFPEDKTIHDDSDQLSLPVIGNVTEPFTQNGKGIMISPTTETVVSAFNRGVVIFAGNDRKTNKTVIIQHPDNSKTTYGHLSSVDVYLYEVVQVNDQIGTFYPDEKNEMVYFSIEQNNSFVDPVQVIQVDQTK